MNLPTNARTQQLQKQYDAFQAQHPKVRIRNAAHAMGVSEMELVAAGAGGIQSVQLRMPAQDLFKELGTLGRVMALTRNDWCIHERHGKYEDIHAGKNMGIVLGPDIDLRMFFSCWGSAWAVNDNGRHSIQFFDTGGTAVHKVFCTEESDLEAYHALVENHKEPDPEWPSIEPCLNENNTSQLDSLCEGLRERWLNMKDVHEFHGMLKDFNVTRLNALHCVGSDLAQEIDNDTAERMLHDVADKQIPIMCFVGNPGLIQIHSGPVQKLLRTQAWFNVLDPHFNLHLDTTAITQTWVVNRPSSDGWITSIECFAANGDLIVQFFGARKPGIPELTEWRELLVHYCLEPLAA